MKKVSDISTLDFTRRIQGAIAERSEEVTYKKGEFLLKEGAIEHHLYFIVEGAVKVYYLSELGEKIIRLGYNGSMINSLASFLSERPSNLYIEAIRKTSARVLDRTVIEEIMQASPDYVRFLETILVQQIDREVDLLLDSPMDRLARVLERSPDLFQHVPLKYIAAYLRMTPETLSRIQKS